MNESASSAKPPLLYFPGLDGTGRLLHRQQDLFEEYDVQCESYPQDRTQTYEELADTGAERLKERRPNTRAIVLAESFGGAVGITFVLKYPELVERIVFVNTFARFPKRVRIRLADWLGRLLPRKPAHPKTRGLRSLFFFNKEIPKEERDEWWKRTEDVPQRAFGYRLQLIAKVDLRSRLAEIEVPALVIVAPNDRVVHPKAGRELAKLLPHATLLEKPVSHAAMAHPEINIAKLLADETYWPPVNSSDNASNGSEERAG